MMDKESPKLTRDFFRRHPTMKPYSKEWESHKIDKIDRKHYKKVDSKFYKILYGSWFLWTLQNCWKT
jgi:hypothetical protein